MAVALGKWPVLNLCKPPHNWASSWAGDYKNCLDVLRTVSAAHQPISHVHYSGGWPTGTAPVDELLYSCLPPAERNRQLLQALLKEASGLTSAKRLVWRVKNRIKRMRKAKQ